MHELLIRPDDLEHMTDAILIDCRASLADDLAGERAWLAGHLPGAFRLDLLEDLSGPQTGRNGRHPLPDKAKLADTLGRMGVGNATQVVVYDDGAAPYAARAWWLLRWLGHEAVAVLDGGIRAWLASGRPLDTTIPAATPARFEIRAPRVRHTDTRAVLDNLADPRLTVIDARGPGRFVGEGETLDPVGGHIPGALNHFWEGNFNPDGTYLDAATLRARWLDVLGGRDPAGIIQQCGSGVSACVNLLAMEIAGLHDSVLYPGSWSEWCSDPSRPVSREAATR